MSTRPNREEYVAKRLDELDATIPQEELEYLEEDKKGNIKKIDITQSPILGKLFREWVEERKPDVSTRTIENYITSFLKFLRVMKSLGKDVETLDRIVPQDLKDFKKVCRDEQLEFFTKSQSLRNHIFVVRMFCVWLCDKFGWNDKIKDKFLKIKSPKITDKKVVESEDLVSANELYTLLRHANNSRDKCLIALCFEAGMRISEALTIKIKHIEILDTHMNIRLRGTKTKNSKRRITIIDSQNFILNWLNEHPYRNDPQAPLFVNISKNYGSPLRYDAARGILNRIINRSGLRHINWHLFRHTAATTEAVRGMNPKLMNKKFGWDEQSKTPFIYIALSENDLEEYELERKGIVIPEKEERERALEPKVCPRCGKINEATAIICNQCGSALDPKVLAQMIEEKDETFDTLKEELEQMKQQNVELMEQMKELFKMMNEKE